MRSVLLLPAFLIVACGSPTADSTTSGDFDPFAEALPRTASSVPAPVAMVLSSDLSSIPVGEETTFRVSGSLGHGERVYVAASSRGTGAGPCLPTAGGLCVDIVNPLVFLGTAVAGASGEAVLTVDVPSTTPVGATYTLQALVVRGFGGAGSFVSNPLPLEAVDRLNPNEGDVIPDWIPFDFADNGYRDGCDGGLKYVKSTPYGAAKYVGITVCSEQEYKIWLGASLFGPFYSVADSSGRGEDHCEYVGGFLEEFPAGTSGVDPQQACWSRDHPGVEPVYERFCAANRFVPSSYRCQVDLPGPGHPIEGTVLPEWTEMPFRNDGYRDGCAGGRSYVRSTQYATAPYVGITVCSPEEYKIWLSDGLHSVFHGAADWAGLGEDHCEYVTGYGASFPQSGGGVDPSESCWSRGHAGAEPVFELGCSANRVMPASYDCSIDLPGPRGPEDGDVLTDWMPFPFVDDGNNDGCAGGTKWVKSTSYTNAPYVGVTRCSSSEHKIWLSDTLYGKYVAPGDWFGLGEDHCEYVDGTFVSFPAGNGASMPGLACWGRDVEGAEPTYEAQCGANRLVPKSYDCDVSIP